MEERKHVELTERQQFWIHHLQQCAISSGTIREYAQTHELSLSVLYAWKKRLQTAGLLGEHQPHPVCFKKIQIIPVATSICGRICFANGTALEWSVHDEGALQAVLRAVSALA